MDLADHGQQPYVFNIEEMSVGNPNFRVAQWTGDHLQVTLMSIVVGGEVGLEVHPDTDQFLRVEQGKATVKMGPAKDNLNFEAAAEDGFAILVPAGTWHNIINIGEDELKLYSIYAPSHHPRGTIQATFADAAAAEAAEAAKHSEN
jgi:mannose-6-phosphate isomerase-like protein (cupin superfamily)